jgi:DNA-binding transcriptional MerR regulator
MGASVRLNVGMRSTERDETMGIGALAGRFGLAAHVLRHWESVGLPAPARDAAGRRRYGSADVVRVGAILRGKEAGLSLDAIRALTAGDRRTRRDVLRREADALRARIAAARASLSVVECALGCTHEELTECPHHRQQVAGLVGLLPGPAAQGAREVASFAPGCVREVAPSARRAGLAASGACAVARRRAARVPGVRGRPDNAASVRARRREPGGTLRTRPRTKALRRLSPWPADGVTPSP